MREQTNFAESATSHSRAESLVQRYESEVAPEYQWYEDSDTFIAWLSLLEGKVTKSTFRSYRQLLARYAESLGETSLAESIRDATPKDDVRPSKLLQQALADDRGGNQEVAADMSVGSIGELGRVLLSKRGSGSRYKNGLVALTWLQLTLMTGVRPVEWRSAVLLQNVETEHGHHFPWVLDVETAKRHQVNRKLGQVSGTSRRRLVLTGWSEGSIEMLQLFMTELPGDAGEFKKLYESVRQTLMKACVVAGIDEGVIGLYTGRHIFASEVRRSQDYSRYALAAMLGHSDTINQKYYGDLDKDGGRRFSFKLPQPWPGTPGQVEALDRRRYALVYAEGAVDMMYKLGELE